MATTAEEFQSILEYVREQLRAHMFLMTHSNGYPVEAVPKATTESLPALVKYDEWKASRTKKKKKVEGIPEEVVKQFEIFWQEYPGISRFEYNGKKFDGERVLKANKQVCLKLYNDIVTGVTVNSKAVEVYSKGLLKALQVQIANVKIESYKSGQNRMQYMKSCEVWLKHKAYEVWIGQEFPEEVIKTVNTNTDINI